MLVKFNNLLKQFQTHKEEYEQKIKDVMESGYYILGNEVRHFEEEFASYVGSKYCEQILCWFSQWFRCTYNCF